MLIRKNLILWYFQSRFIVMGSYDYEWWWSYELVMLILAVRCNMIEWVTFHVWPSFQGKETEHGRRAVGILLQFSEIKKLFSTLILPSEIWSSPFYLSVYYRNMPNESGHHSRNWLDQIFTQAPPTQVINDFGRVYIAHKLNG